PYEIHAGLEFRRVLFRSGPLEAQRLFGTSTQCHEHPTIERDLRTIRRSGPVGELLAVYVGAKSEIRVEPYCWNQQPSSVQPAVRSEERRLGKEWSSVLAR